MGKSLDALKRMKPKSAQFSIMSIIFLIAFIANSLITAAYAMEQVLIFMLLLVHWFQQYYMEYLHYIICMERSLFIKQMIRRHII